MNVENFAVIFPTLKMILLQVYAIFVSGSIAYQATKCSSFLNELSFQSYIGKSYASNKRLSGSYKKAWLIAVAYQRFVYSLHCIMCTNKQGTHMFAL